MLALNGTLSAPRVASEKWRATLRARAALLAAQLLDIEDDDGSRCWILTRGSATWRFRTNQHDELEAAIADLESVR
jgi:hypothetical protein